MSAQLELDSGSKEEKKERKRLVLVSNRFLTFKEVRFKRTLEIGDGSFCGSSAIGKLFHML